jgi:hypothetical protein
MACGSASDMVMLSVHQINNLPKGMQQIDPSRVQFELSVQTTAKYYLQPTAGGVQQQTSSIVRIELQPLAIAFSSAAILFRKERFIVDLEASGSKAMAGTAAAAGGSSSPPDEANRVAWRFPSPAQTYTVLEIFVGAKERRVGSSTAHWISSSSSSPQSSGAATPGEQQGVRFLVSVDSILTNRTVTKFVGLSIGQVVMTFSVVKGDPCAVARIKRFIAASKPKLDTVTAEGILQQHGDDEILAMSALRKLVNPSFFRRRAEKLVQLYTPDQANSARMAEILKDMEGREEEVLRSLAIELGPELCSIAPKHRLAAFMKKFKIGENDVAGHFPNGVYSTSLLENDPEKVFDILTAKYGTEPRPTSYLFPSVAYEPDRRSFLMEHLAFPVNKPNGKNWRDTALAARQKRVPFTNSPLERELSKVSRSGRQLSEIEILQEKHDPEFKQIIPSIAEALTSVLAQHAQIAKSLPKDERFAVYETNSVPGIQLDDYVHRIAEYTYISPASMLAAAIFLDRLCERYSNMLLTEKNIFKLFFVAVRVSSKVVDLRSLNNKNFASVGGVGIKHLNDLEEAFLKHLRFDLFLSPIEFGEYVRRLQPPLSHSSVPRHISNATFQQQQQQQ